MKTDLEKNAASKALDERLFKIFYQGAVVLALLGAALFLVLQLTRLGRRNVVLVSSPHAATNHDHVAATNIQSGFESLHQERETLLHRLAAAEKELSAGTNALLTLEEEHRQTVAKLESTEKKLASLEAGLELKSAESPPAPDNTSRVGALEQAERDLKQAIEKLTADRRASEESLRRVQQDNNQAVEQLAKVRQQIEKAQQDAQKANGDAQRKRQEQQRVDNEVKRLKQQQATATREVNRLRTEQRALEAKRRQSDTALAQVQQRKSQIEADLGGLQKKQQNLADEVWRLTAQTLSINNELHGSSAQGLRATYFRSRDLTGPGVTRIDPVVNFDWKDQGPIAEIGGDNFSARWEGQLEAPASGTFTLHTVSNDGIRLWVNGKRIIDQWDQHGPTEHTGTIVLEAGQKYDLKMEYFEAGGTAVARLAWSGPGLARTIVPTSNLFPKKN